MLDFDEERKKLLMIKRAIRQIEDGLDNLKFYVADIEEKLMDKESETFPGWEKLEA